MNLKISRLMRIHIPNRRQTGEQEREALTKTDHEEENELTKDENAESGQ